LFTTSLADIADTITLRILENKRLRFQDISMALRAPTEKHHVYSRLLGSKFIRYFIIGSIAATLQLVLLYLLVQYGEMSEYLASQIALLGAIVLNYFLQRHFTFKSTASHTFALPSFVAMSILASLVNFLAFSALLPYLHYIAAQCVSLIVVFLFNFMISSRIIFAKA
jgi:putative flippase GtrA